MAQAVNIKHMHVQEVKHTMKAARLLYTAPGFILRGPIYLVFVITVAGVAYSFWGKVDTVVSCLTQLKKDETKIQAPLGGFVSAVYVSPNSRFEPLTNLADIQFKLDADSGTARENLEEQLEKLMDRKKQIKEGTAIMSDRLLGLQKTLKNEQKKLGDLKIDEEREDLEFKAQIDTAYANIKSAENTLESSKTDVDRFQKLLDSTTPQLKTAQENLAKEMELLGKKLTTTDAVEARRAAVTGIQQQLITLESNLKQAKDSVGKFQLALEEARKEPDRLKNEIERRKLDRTARRGNILETISQTEFQIRRESLTQKQSEEEIDKEIEKVKKRLEESATLLKSYRLKDELCTVFTDYGGLVTNVYVKAGQQIGTGEVLLSVIKDTESLYAEIMVENRDIGRLKEGDEVKIKYDAFPYQDYGTQVGEITYISPTPMEQQGLETMYRVKVHLTDKGNMPVSGKSNRFKSDEINVGSGAYDATGTLTPNARWKPLPLGLRGIADIKVGEKKLIEVIFTPISKFFGSDE